MSYVEKIAEVRQLRLLRFELSELEGYKSDNEMVAILIDSRIYELKSLISLME